MPPNAGCRASNRRLRCRVSDRTNWPDRAASVDVKAQGIGARLGRIRVPAGWSADTGRTQPARLCTRSARCDGYALALLDARQLSATRERR